MSDFVELFYPREMIGKIMENGEIIAEFPIENCDGCSKLKRLDKFGYTKGQAGEKLIWMCGSCR